LTGIVRGLVNRGLVSRGLVGRSFIVNRSRSRSLWRRVFNKNIESAFYSVHPRLPMIKLRVEPKKSV
jgi:hypothetical protein